MEILEELDKNEYAPNVDDPEEISKRTYGEAKEYLKKEYLYIRFISDQIAKGKKFSPEQSFDIRQSMAHELGKASETFLKALYIKNRGITGDKLEKIWDEQKKLNYHEKKGDKLYKKIGKIVDFPMYNDTNKIVIDDNGVTVYENSDNIVHQLDKLLKLLPIEYRTILELKVVTSPIKNASNAQSIMELSQADRIINLVNKGDDYGIIESDRIAYNEAKGIKPDAIKGNLDFMYHLVLQLDLLANSMINSEELVVTNYKKDEYKEIPGYVLSIFSDNAKLLSQELYGELAGNMDLMSKCKSVIHDLSLDQMNKITPTSFYKSINNFTVREMKYIIYIDQLIRDMKRKGEEYVVNTSHDMFLITKIAKFFKDNSYDINDLVSYFSLVKTNGKGVQIDFDFLEYLDNRLISKKEAVKTIDEETTHKVISVKEHGRAI